MMETLVQDGLVPILLTILTALAAWLSTTVRDWIKRKARETDNQILSTVLGLAGQTAATAVAEVAQTTVEQLRAAREDGRITPDEAKAAFNKATERAWGMLGKSARDILTEHAGSEEAAKESIIGPLIEQMVGATKGQASASPPSDDTSKARDVALARSRLGLQ